MSKDAPCAITNAFPTDDTIYSEFLVYKLQQTSACLVSAASKNDALYKVCKSSYVRSPTPLFVIFLVPSLMWSTCHDVELIFLIHIPWKKSFLLNYNTHFIFRLTTTIKRLVSSHDIVDSPILCSLIFSEKIDQNALSIPFIKTKCLPFYWK